MLKVEFVYRELLFQALEKKNREFTQKGLSGRLGVSLSNINHALKPLKRMNAVKVNPRNLVLVNPKKVLFYWASIRNFGKDIVYRTRVDASVREIEKSMPAGVFFSGYSGFRFSFNDAPADYSNVYVYARDLGEVKKRFPEKKPPFNLFVLQSDSLLESYGKLVPVGQLFVDLWNLPEWQARDFLKAIEVRISGLLE